jgi:putative transcriptional regulator
MSPRHHPSETVLLGLAAGALGRGAPLVVEAHLRACPACRAEVARLEAVGGALLEELPPAEMASNALARTLARLDGPPPRAAPLAESAESAAALQDLPVGRRRWLAPGIWMRPIVRGPRGLAYLLRTGPGAALLAHGHTGEEYVSVLRGAFSDETGRYGPGDFAQSDERLTHRPVADPGEECLCLIWAEGPMRMRTLLGRALQPLVGL